MRYFTGGKFCHDSEEIGEHVRQTLYAESKKDFDHSGGNELPIRKDVLGYVRGRLFKAESGLITAGGLPLPEVSMDIDGTAKIVFTVDGRHLCFWVPCHGVVVLERYTEEADSYLQFVLKSEDDPENFDDEVERGFLWLAGGDE